MSDETGQSAIRSSTAKQIKEHVHSSKSSLSCQKSSKMHLFYIFFSQKICMFYFFFVPSTKNCTIAELHIRVSWWFFHNI